MKASKKTEGRGLRVLAAACYLLSVALCGLAAYGLARLMAPLTADAVERLYHPLGIF
jgi:hypothetical protein